MYPIFTPLSVGCAYNHHRSSRYTKRPTSVVAKVHDTFQNNTTSVRDIANQVGVLVVSVASVRVLVVLL